MGRGRGQIGGEAWIVRLQFSLPRRLLPAAGQGRRPSSRSPPQNPRHGRGYDTPEMAPTVQVAFDTAKPPAWLWARVSDKKALS